MNWPRKHWIYFMFCFWSFLQWLGWGFFLLSKIVMVLARDVTVAKPKYSGKDKEMSCLVVAKYRRGNIH